MKRWEYASLTRMVDRQESGVLIRVRIERPDGTEQRTGEFEFDMLMSDLGAEGWELTGPVVVTEWATKPEENGTTTVWAAAIRADFKRRLRD